MSRDAFAERVSARFRSRFLRRYTASKLRSDPVYREVAQRLRGHELPLLDIGCGVGLMAQYLRESGYEAPIDGIDSDERKIAAAQRTSGGLRGLSFRAGDARSPIDHRGSVLLIDVLHYLSGEEQERLLARIVRMVVPGGLVLVREGVRDESWRYRATLFAEQFARMIGWNRSEMLNFPARSNIVGAFAGFDAEVVSLWGRTPFNNYLFVFRRPASGTTNE